MRYVFFVAIKNLISNEATIFTKQTGGQLHAQGYKETFSS